MKKLILLLFVTATLISFNGCKDVEAGTEYLNYVSFESASFDFGVDLDSQNSRDITIYATQVTGSDRTFAINIIADETTADPASYDVPASVTIPANSNIGTFTVTVSDLNISEAGETLAIEFGAEGGIYSSEYITLNIKQVCPLNEVIFDATFDSWPEETGWTLKNSAGDVIDGAGYGTYAGYSDFTKAFCLEDGEYTFTIYDQYGDGTDNYKLIYNGTILAEGGAFGSSEATTFTVSM